MLQREDGEVCGDADERRRAERARRIEDLREALAQIDAGDLTAGPIARAHIAGAIAALEVEAAEDS